jgi:hypothetical protein
MNTLQISWHVLEVSCTKLSGKGFSTMLGWLARKLSSKLKRWAFEYRKILGNFDALWGANNFWSNSKIGYVGCMGGMLVCNNFLLPL